MLTAFIADPVCKEHDTGTGHPESSKRFDAVLGAFGKSGALEKFSRLEPRNVSMEDLELAHTPAYLRKAEKEIREGRNQLSTGDTSISLRSWEAAMRGAGSALAGVDAVVGGKAPNAFCLVRPPG